MSAIFFSNLKYYFFECTFTSEVRCFGIALLEDDLRKIHWSSHYKSKFIWVFTKERFNNIKNGISTLLCRPEFMYFFVFDRRLFHFLFYLHCGRTMLLCFDVGRYYFRHVFCLDTHKSLSWAPYTHTNIVISLIKAI